MGARRDLLLRVPAGATVLDVGCWDGALGGFLQRERGATVDGIEPDPEAAEQAVAAYRRVLPATVEESLDELKAKSYDALLLLDVLEHLVDPWDVLRRCRSLLRPGGSAFVSLPNVAHWSVRKNLLMGRWEYRDFGIMDRTHLRFFTRQGARELLTASGWNPVWEGASVGQPPIVRLPGDFVNRLARWPALFAVQFLIEAQPTPITPAAARPD